MAPKGSVVVKVVKEARPAGIWQRLQLTNLTCELEATSNGSYLSPNGALTIADSSHPVTFSMRVTNEGHKAAVDFRVDFALYIQQHGGDAQYSEKHKISLSPKQMWERSVTSTFNLQGIYTINVEAKLIVDAEKTISEYNEGDNICIFPLMISFTA